MSWADEVTYTFTTKEWNATSGGSAANWTSGKDGGGFSNNGIQVTGSQSANGTSPVSFSNVSQIVVTYNTNKSAGAGTLKIKIGDNEEVSNSVAYSGSKDGRSANFTSTFNFSPSQSGNVKLSIVGSTNSLYIVSITITYSGGGGGGGSTVSTPSFLPAAGTYTTAQSVSISCATDGATIYYTTNGDDPDDSDSRTEYTSAVSITTSGTTLKAIAYKDGMTKSSVASATYTIKPTTPTISAAGATVTISGGDGCTFYYTTNGTTPTSSSTKYTAPFDLLADCTIKAIAYDTYGNASSVSSDYKFKYMPLAPKNINSGYFVKVTDVSDLENGDAILIVCETDDRAMSTTQETNYRGHVGVTPSAGVIYAPSASVQKITLVKKSEDINSDDVDDDVFYFYVSGTSTGYLYAASSSSNYLKTEATPDDNARATISISSGDATIIFTGTYTRNNLRHNNKDSRFSCYNSTSTLELVQIYKEVAHNVPVTVSPDSYATLSSSFALDFTSTTTKAYIAKKKTSSTVTLTQVNKVPANTGVLLYKDGGTTENIPVFNGIGADDKTGNVLKASDGSVTGDEETIFALGKKNGTIGFYLVGDGVTVPAGKAYIEATGGSLVKVFTFDFEDDADGINSLTPALSEGEGAIYNLAGQRISKMQKGINIVNGKKVLR